MRVLGLKSWITFSLISLTRNKKLILRQGIVKWADEKMIRERTRSVEWSRWDMLSQSASLVITYVVYVSKSSRMKVRKSGTVQGFFYLAHSSLTAFSCRDCSDPLEQLELQHSFRIMMCSYSRRGCPYKFISSEPKPVDQQGLTVLRDTLQMLLTLLSLILSRCSTTAGNMWEMWEHIYFPI